MPLTFLSHQAPVVPLKVARPRHVDGTALVVGSITPDLVYAGHGVVDIDSHTLAALLWFCVPVTTALTWIVKRHLAGVLGAHLPDAGSLHLQDYQRLSGWRTSRRAWALVIVSALAGSLTHIVLDSFTHSYGWTVQHVEVLQGRLDVPWFAGRRATNVYAILQHTGTIAGGLMTLSFLHRIGRERLIRSWYPGAPRLVPTRRSHVRLWACTATGAGAGIAWVAASYPQGALHTDVLRIADATLAATAVGCLVARRSMEQLPADEPSPAVTT